MLPQTLVILNAVWVMLGICIIIIFGLYVRAVGFDLSRARVRAAVWLTVYFAGATGWHAVGIGLRLNLLSPQLTVGALVLSAALGLTGAVFCIRTFSPIGSGGLVAGISAAFSLAAALAARYYLT